MPTISIVSLWNQVQTTAKSGTSGYQSQADFNSDLDTIQKRIANILCDNYERSQKIEDALFGLIVSQNGATSNSGIITNPSDYFRLIGAWVTVAGIPYPANKIAVNQVPAYATSFVRKPSVSTNGYCFYYVDGAIQMMPAMQLNCSLIYCKVPPTATIILTPTSGTNSDYITPTAGADLIWSTVVYNLFYYMMLEMLGIEQKDNILYEFSQLGIPKEAYIGSSVKEAAQA